MIQGPAIPRSWDRQQPHDRFRLRSAQAASRSVQLPRRACGMSPLHSIRCEAAVDQASGGVRESGPVRLLRCPAFNGFCNVIGQANSECWLTSSTLASVGESDEVVFHVRLLAMLTNNAGMPQGANRATNILAALIFTNYSHCRAEGDALHGALGAGSAGIAIPVISQPCAMARISAALAAAATS